MAGEGGFTRGVSLAAALLGLLIGLLVSSTVSAQVATVSLNAEGSDHTWDCWVSSDTPRGVVSYAIRCIHDRPYTNVALVDAQTVEGLLDYVHQMIHAGEFATLDRDLSNGLGASIAGYLWSIRIHQYPYEESWDAGLPQRLVQAALCDTTEACPVLLFRGAMAYGAQAVGGEGLVQAR